MPNVEFEKEVSKLTQTISRLQQENQGKQSEVEQLTVKLLDVSTTTENLAKLEQEARDFRESQIVAEKKITELQRELDSDADRRSSIADVMIDAKDSSKQIVSRAEFEAHQILEKAKLKASRMVSEASTELAMIQKEAADYYRQLAYTKEESVVVFEQLLTKLSDLKGKKS